MPTTVKDIAIAAGVSKAAVSKVLHNSSASVRVSEVRAAQIRRLAEEMGYVPNANARSLRSNRTQTIGIYFEDLAGIAAGPLYTTHLLDGVCRVLFNRHYRATLVAELDHSKTAHSLGDGRLDGVIWCRVVRDETSLDIMRNSPIPIVAMNATPVLDSEKVLYVRCDNIGGMELAIDHLWSLGHRKLLFVREAKEAEVADCVDRLTGFTEAIQRRGGVVEPADIVSWTWNLDEFEDWWWSLPPHTGVIGWTERCAGQVLRKCTQMGIRVPEQLSVVGFDSTQFCETTKPALTAVRQPIIEMGKLAAELLLNLLDGETLKESTYTLSCPLDIRSSTGPARQA